MDKANLTIVGNSKGATVYLSACCHSEHHPICITASAQLAKQFTTYPALFDDLNTVRALYPSTEWRVVVQPELERQTIVLGCKS